VLIPASEPPARVGDHGVHAAGGFPSIEAAQQKLPPWNESNPTLAKPPLRKIVCDFPPSYFGFAKANCATFAIASRQSKSAFIGVHQRPAMIISRR